MKEEYCVWQRSDGYVGATAGGWPVDHNAGYGHPAVTFDHLASFDNWPDALNFIQSMRGVEIE